MKLCILSDSHDNRSLLANAVDQAKTMGAETVIHCGDVVAPSTLSVLKKYEIPVHVIHGNNTGDLYTMGTIANKPDNLISYYGQDARLDFGNKQIFVVHYPHYARGMALTGDWDIVCCGHSHKPMIDKIKSIKNSETLLMNPGSVAGLDGDATFIFGDTESMEFKIIKFQ